MTRSSGRRALESCALAAALGLHVALATLAVVNKSNTFDEIAHLTAGYAYWAFNDYRLQPENGNWPQRLGALPAVAAKPAFPDRTGSAWRQSNVWTLGDEFFFRLDNDIDRILWQGRLLVALLSAGVGALVFAWARRLVGSIGAWVAVSLFVWSPTMLAHGALVTSDMAVTVALFAAVGAVWRVLHRITPWTVALSAVACAAPMLAKFSGVLIVPIAAVLVVVRWWRPSPLIWRVRRGARWRAIQPRGRQAVALGALALAHVLVAWVMVWASYGFRYSAFSSAEGDPRFLPDWSVVLGDPSQKSLVREAIAVARDYRVLPEAFLYGFSHTMTAAEGRPTFMNGEVSSSGRASFFPYAFAIKTTLPLLAMLGVAVTAIVYAARGRRRRLLYRLSPLLILILVYGATALTTDLNIGHRHLLPIYPALMVLGGMSALWWQPGAIRPRGTGLPRKKRTRRVETAPVRRQLGRGRTAMGVAAAGLCLWHVGESLSVRPHYLAYFNQVAGGPAQGYRRLVDSSLDWGQDLPGLKAWLDSHRRDGTEPVYLSYFGTSRPSHFGIDATRLPGFIDARESITGDPLRPGLYCISATMLAGVYTLTDGRWTADDESSYQEAMTTVVELQRNQAQRAAAAQEAGEDMVPVLLDMVEQLRLARLTTYLSRRVPLASIGHSILVYRLTQEDLNQALTGPLSSE